MIHKCKVGSMKAVILAGGLGTRISEETHTKPKPMIEIGGRPILWHIMKLYSHYGVNEFVICCGYKGYVIKEYFINYFDHMSDLTIDLVDNKVEVHQHSAEPWRVTLVDTGEETNTGGRLKRVRPYLGDDIFHFTYGDGVSDVAIDKLVEFHRSHGKLATLTAAFPPGRFGALDVLPDGSVSNFREKPRGDNAVVNAGFFVLSPQVIDYIEGDAMAWEATPLQSLAENGQLSAYRHEGFWQPMDTLRDKNLLEGLWSGGDAPWKVWQ